MPIPRLFGRSSQPSELSCRRARPEDRAAALAFALGGTVARAAEMERRAQREGLNLDRAWVGFRGPAFVGSAVLIPHPGRTALLVAGTPRDREHADDLAALVRHALQDRAAHAEIDLVQSLTEPGHRDAAHVMGSGGLRHLATLEYLERPGSAGARPARELPPGCRVEAWDPRDRALMADLLARTSEDSLDCPGLSAMRDPADVLEGHLAASSHDASAWHVAWRHGAPVGVALLSLHSDARNVELIYLGLVPGARGSGLGTALLDHSLRDAAMRRNAPVSLAVDLRNEPATRMYARAGFVPVRRREAWVTSLRA
ncbi:MAG: GNAT family N-acetyltransferase [Phycisphaerales bacterium]